MPKNKIKTCANGHPRTKANRYTSPTDKYGRVQCVPCRAIAVEKNKAKKAALDTSEPGAEVAKLKPKKGSGVREGLAAEYADLAIEELLSILSTSKSERNRHNAALAFVTLREKSVAAGIATDPAVIARQKAALEEQLRIENDPVYAGQVFTLRIASGGLKLPEGWTPPSASPAELVEPETLKLLPEPEPAKVEEAQIVPPEPCLCTHQEDKHERAPSGQVGGCTCCGCNLYVSFSEAMESRNRDPQT